MRTPDTDLPALLKQMATPSDEERTASFARDAWPIAAKWSRSELAEHVPAGVLRPRDDEDVMKMVTAARAAGRSVVAVGGGSGVCGAAIPDARSLIMDMKGLGEIRAFDQIGMTVSVGAGVLGGVLEEWLSEKGFTCGHYPQSLHISTVGGWLATRGTGTFSNKYGGIEKLVQALKVILPDGTSMSLGHAPRSAAGPNLMELFFGSEGTLGIVTEITLRIFPKPRSQIFAAFRMPSLDSGVQAVREFFFQECTPALVRLYDPEESQHLYDAAGEVHGGALLLLGHEGHERIAEAEAAACGIILSGLGATILPARVAETWNAGRYRAAWLDANQLSDTIADSIEVSVGWAELMTIYDDVMAKIRPLCTVAMGHLSHFYQTGGMIYFIFQIQDPDTASLKSRYARVWSIVTEAALAYGGTTTHHHGVGLARRSVFPKEIGEAAAAFLQTIKSAVDPDNILNPGKLAFR
jgi:alkyldihydroxyacetonephosphate synthase